ncbi:MAG TPA: hypothetical protein VKJ45_09500, partial [Blastocatellia bacterium]|nr:hypothetical protein [Blastocatellia bacterium]
MRAGFPGSQKSLHRKEKSKVWVIAAWLGSLVILSATATGQLIDKTRAPNAANEGIHKSLVEEIGSGRGDVNTPGSSSFIINR